MPGAPSVQMPQRFFRSNPVRVASVSMERRSSRSSKLEDREGMKTGSCIELLMLMSADSSTARENKLASLLTFVERGLTALRYHLAGVVS